MEKCGVRNLECGMGNCRPAMVAVIRWGLPGFTICGQMVRRRVESPTPSLTCFAVLPQF